MKYLGTFSTLLGNTSHQVTYDLYFMSIVDLRKRLLGTLGKSLTQLQIFNNDISRDLFHLHNREKDLSDSYSIRNNYKLIEKFKDGRLYDKDKALALVSGINSSFIQIECSSIEDNSAPIYLLDGFNRLFTYDELPEIEVLVKVYKQLSDVEWVNLLVEANAWKIATYDIENLFNRGLLLSIYQKRNGQIFDFKPCSAITSFQCYLNAYFEKDYRYNKSMTVISTLWDNPYFFDDLLLVNQIVTHEFNDLTLSHGFYNTLLELSSFVGKTRRYEYENGLIRGVFNFSVFEEFCNRNAGHLKKLNSMVVPGRISNYISTHLSEELKRTFLTGFGHEYTAKKDDIKSSSTSVPFTSVLLNNDKKANQEKHYVTFQEFLKNYN